MKASHKETLLNFYRTHSRMPSYAELMKVWKYRGKGAVSYALQKLIREGVVGKDTKGRLVPLRLHTEVRLLGVVEAGFPTGSEEELIDTISLDEYLIENKEATYMLCVKGDSMAGAGILPGDLILVERGREPRGGDIVIALIDGAYTMKYFRRKGKIVWLEAANSKYRPLHPKDELNVEAVVTAVIRRYA